VLVSETTLAFMAVKDHGGPVGGGAVVQIKISTSPSGECAGGWLVRRVTLPGQVCGRPFSGDEVAQSRCHVRRG
jgi:hypothetical protein